MRITRKHRFSASVFAIGLALVVVNATASGASPTFAKATLLNTSGQEIGEVRFQRDHGTIVGRAQLSLPLDSAEFHGFHVHANNPDPNTGVRPGCDPTTGFVSVGGHWDTGGHTHGSHTGDLPSLLRQSDGEAEVTFVLDKFTPEQLFGHAIVVHVGADNLGNVPRGTAANQYTDNGTAYDGPGGTAATGNAGARYACGVIEKK